MEILSTILRRGRGIAVLILLLPLLYSCKTTKRSSYTNESLTGTYYLTNKVKFQAFTDKNYSTLEIKDDGTYILNKAEMLFTPIIEQCDYASSGKWTLLAKDVIEIISEDYYTVQEGFEYEIKKEKKLSQDSVYIQVIFSDDFEPPVRLRFGFNSLKVGVLQNGETYISLPKSEYLWDRKISTNRISFNVDANIYGVKLYRSRINFPIFDEDINTEESNYLTIILPNFNQCFFEFEPHQDIIFFKGRNKLLWLGEVWKKQMF